MAKYFPSNALLVNLDLTELFPSDLHITSGYKFGWVLVPIAPVRSCIAGPPLSILTPSSFRSTPSFLGSQHILIELYYLYLRERRTVSWYGNRHHSHRTTRFTVFPPHGLLTLIPWFSNRYSLSCTTCCVAPGDTCV